MPRLQLVPRRSGRALQRHEEEAAISAALVRVAQALTTSLDAQDILTRLNEAVRQALDSALSAG